MFKYMLNAIKKIIVGILLIYAYNKMAVPLNVFIPINLFTVLLVSFCGIPSIIMLILFSLICI